MFINYSNFADSSLLSLDSSQQINEIMNFLFVFNFLFAPFDQNLTYHFIIRDRIVLLNMNVYPLLYRNFISKFPSQFHEFIGGYVLQIAEKMMVKPNTKKKVNLLGLKFNNPVGMPSGWADSPEKIDLIHNLGAGVVVSKTITLQPRIGNPYPRIIRGRLGLINSMGLPNYGLKWWLQKLSKWNRFEHPRILSIQGDNFKEWSILVDTLERHCDILELNFSCPNLKHGLMDLNKSETSIKEIASISNSRIFLKISPEFSSNQNLAFITKIRHLIDGVTAINTVPITHNSLGNPQNRGGLSGSPIHSRLLNQLQVLRDVYPTQEDLAIFATGGIMNPVDAIKIHINFDVFPLALTGFFMKGPDFYFQILKQLPT